MQIYEMKMDNGLELKEKLEGLGFAEVSSTKTVLEKDVQNLIAKHPEILNYEETANCKNSKNNSDLLIIGTEVTTALKNRCDILAIDKDGNLITVEVKRDVKDGKVRKEPCEFQAIRYAAANRTMQIDEIIQDRAEYLKATNKNKNKTEDDDKWAERARSEISKHLRNYVKGTKLEEYIDPQSKQKIFLVASDFEPECLSACAWLREKNIDIHCIKLQPYKIGSEYILVRERLIPTKQLEDYLETMSIYKKKADKNTLDNNNPEPIYLYINNNPKEACLKWKKALLKVLQYAINNGLTIDDLNNELSITCGLEQDVSNWKSYRRIDNKPDTITYKNGEQEITVYVSLIYSGKQCVQMIKKTEELINKKKKDKLEIKFDFRHKDEVIEQTTYKEILERFNYNS